MAIKRFRLANHYRKGNKDEPIDYVGYDAWGKVIVDTYMGEVLNSAGEPELALLSVRARLDEKSNVLGDLTAKLNLNGDEYIERIYEGFDVDFNLTEQKGWAVTIDKGLGIPGAAEKFDLIRQIATDGEPMFFKGRNSEYIGVNSHRREFVRFYNIKDLIALVDLGETANILSEAIREKLELNGNEKIERIYSADANHNLNELIGYSINLGPRTITVDNKTLTYNLMLEIDTSGDIERVFGTHPVTGEEVVEFFMQPQIVEGVKTRGVVVIELGETANELPKEIRTARGYEGKEPLKRIYYFGDNYDILTTLEIKGYGIEVKDRIQGHSNWSVTEEITADGEFVVARAVDSRGDERGTVSALPEGGFSVDIIDYQDNEIIKITTYKSERNSGIYKLIEKLSTFDVFTGEKLNTAISEFNTLRNALPDLKPYGFDKTYNETLAELLAKLGKTEEDIYAGILHKENNGTYIAVSYTHLTLPTN